MDILKDITVSDFKEYFAKDFRYGTNLGNIFDSDITKALTEALAYIDRRTIPFRLLKIAFLYLAAHFLVMNYRLSFAGIQDVGQQIVISNSEGVSESYVIPTKFKNNAVVNYYAKSGYGLKFLSIVLPNLIGHVSTGASFPSMEFPQQRENPYGFI